jgi:hypothetical protein
MERALDGTIGVGIIGTEMVGMEIIGGIMDTITTIIFTSYNPSRRGQSYPAYSKQNTVQRNSLKTERVQ